MKNINHIQHSIIYRQHWMIIKMIERIMIDLKLDYNQDDCMYGIVLYLHCIVFGLYCIYIQLYLYCIDCIWIVFTLNCIYSYCIVCIVLYLHLFVISLLNLSNVIYFNIIHCIICICRDWVCFIIVLIVYGSLYNTAMLRSPIYQLHPEI